MNTYTYLVLLEIIMSNILVILIYEFLIRDFLIKFKRKNELPEEEIEMSPEEFEDFMEYIEKFRDKETKKDQTNK